MGVPLRRLPWLGLVVLVTLILAACGGGDGGSGSSDAPVISNLRVTPLNPERAGTTIRYLFSVDYFDLQADVFNGECEVTATRGSQTVTASHTIDQLGPGADPNAQQGRVVCLLLLRVLTPGAVSGQMTVIDRAGHRSNAMGFALGIQELPVGTAPLTGSDAFEIVAESATLGRRP